MIQNDNVNINEFLQITAGGLSVASFTQIRAALVKRYQSVYGSDIDLSTGSADGIFVNDLALIINNILRTMEIFYSNLDVNTASGIYLDTLCALSNVTRKQATYSNASIQITNSTNSSVTLQDPVFLDSANNEWVYNGTITLAANETAEVTVTCTVLGPISAPAGWITQTVDLTGIDVEQPNDANIGSDVESDSALRARRNQSSGANGVTVLESLSGALLNISGIKDVSIYNNNSGSSITSKDSTSVAPHSIYVIIRRDPGVEIADETIGSLIHEKLTPGIQSCETGADASNGIDKNYPYTSETFSSMIIDAGSDTYWKECVPIAPQIEITINTMSYFSTDEFDGIGKDLINYLNNLPISSNLNQTDILIETVFADPQFKNKPTYTVGAITIASATNPDTYYNYTSATYQSTGANTYKLTLT